MHAAHREDDRAEGRERLIELTYRIKGQQMKRPYGMAIIQDEKKVNGSGPGRMHKCDVREVTPK